MKRLASWTIGLLAAATLAVSATADGQHSNTQPRPGQSGQVQGAFGAGSPGHQGPGMMGSYGGVHGPAGEMIGPYGEVTQMPHQGYGTRRGNDSVRPMNGDTR